MTTFWARIDSGVANNPSLNLTGDASIEITFVADGPSGDLILERPLGGGDDPDTLIVIDGVSYNFTYEFSGTMPTQNSNGAQQVPEQFEGSVVAVITVQDYPAPGDTTRLVFMPEENATQAEMDSFGNGAIDPQNLDTTPPPTPVCFCRGTRIETPNGSVAIEDLQIGDQVKTLDNGDRPIRWIGSMIVPALGSTAPIRIRAGALDNTNDLLVSPQHRMLLTGSQIELLFGKNEVLASAKSLVNDSSIHREVGGMVEYFHILFDKHEIIFAEGAACESFHPGIQALDSLCDDTRNEILAMFPELEDENAQSLPTARLCLKSYESKIAVDART